MTALACEALTPYPHQAIAGPQLRSERGISTRWDLLMVCIPLSTSSLQSATNC